MLFAAAAVPPPLGTDRSQSRATVYHQKPRCFDIGACALALAAASGKRPVRGPAPLPSRLQAAGRKHPTGRITCICRICVLAWKPHSAAKPVPPPTQTPPTSSQRAHTRASALPKPFHDAGAMCAMPPFLGRSRPPVLPAGTLTYSLLPPRPGRPANCPLRGAPYNRVCKPRCKPRGGGYH